MDTALYFPYINPPQAPWFSQILLYWDQAAAIVPRSIRDPANISREAVDLVNHRLLTYLDPEVYPHRQKFQQGFLDAVRPSLHIPPADDRMFVKLHTGKMSQEMFASLRERGLARPADPGGDPGWWMIESTVANAYMAYLAAAMSGATPGMLPVTDRQRAIANLAEPDAVDPRDPAERLADAAEPAEADEALDARLARLRYVLVRHALPAPSGPVPAQELRRFKDRHEDRLRRCRHHLDARLASLAKDDDPAHRTVQAAELLDAIHDNVEVLAAKMRQRRWPKVLLVGVGGVTSTALAVAGIVATGGAPLAVGLAAGCGVLDIRAAGYGLAELLTQPRYDKRAPLAYAALVERVHSLTT
jgi:hypothetical protein